MKSRIKEGVRRLFQPVAVLLNRLGLTPNQVTLVGLLLSFSAAWFAAGGRFVLATVLLVAGSLCDMLDGSMARLGHKESRFGAFLDSTMDRYAELALFLGYAVYFASAGQVGDVAVTFTAAAGSILVSYARARAEGLGVPCTVGLMERPERLVLMMIATALGPLAIHWAMIALAVLTHLTALQRILHVRGRLERESS